ncbi:MAG TPA: co-chaperone GroES [Candidatus Aminicenantes bacterium]|nr:co-chaperone GroES [Candidatus Aminicenantes bacterium]
MKFAPLYDRIVVKRVEEKEVKKGSIIIPDTAKEKPQKAQVIAVGPGNATEEGKVIPLTVKIGDFVLIGKYAGNELRVDDNEYVFLREDEILSKIEE